MWGTSIYRTTRLNPSFRRKKIAEAVTSTVVIVVTRLELVPGARV